jgi:hypothetical protein
MIKEWKNEKNNTIEDAQDIKGTNDLKLKVDILAWTW